MSQDLVTLICTSAYFALEFDKCIILVHAIPVQVENLRDVRPFTSAIISRGQKNRTIDKFFRWQSGTFDWIVGVWVTGEDIQWGIVLQGTVNGCLVGVKMRCKVICVSVANITINFG